MERRSADAVAVRSNISHFDFWSVGSDRHGLFPYEFSEEKGRFAPPS
jgi:hypothetical protein